jgi:hypothetical protein
MNRVFLLFLISIAAFSFEKQLFAMNSGDIEFGLGYLPINLNATTTNAAGSVSTMDVVYYPLILQTHFQMTADAFISPRLAFTITPRETIDKTADVMVTLLSFPVSLPLDPAGDLNWNFGFGLMKIEQKGKGGSKTLNNGSSTATFYRPNYVSTTQMVTFETGIGYSITPQLATKLDFIFTDFLAETRDASMLLSLSYAMNIGGL